MKKTEKKVKTRRERKKLGVKKVKKAAKSGREKPKVPVKKSEKWQKIAFTPTFFFTPKKKNTGWKGGGRLISWDQWLWN